jgi:hypothetical protein
MLRLNVSAWKASTGVSRLELAVEWKAIPSKKRTESGEERPHLLLPNTSMECPDRLDT